MISLITVTNVGHTIQLNGVVTSWAVLDAAEDTAWQGPGVIQVVDDLEVVP
ncbi:MAG TPA: BON domain-containing protein [Acidimicrobiia bacterium]|jgi:osmotically-inducible protein OsmY|nr:BON domain-containing protein [Acidimicrobiia bacterium]